MNDGNPVGGIGIILIPLGVIVLWILLREFICWYYKINERISLQKRTIQLLEQLVATNHGASTQSLTISNDLDINIANGGISIFVDEKGEHGLACTPTDLSNGCMWPNAKNICYDSRFGGFNDWRLPTIDELQLIYKNIHKNEGAGFSAVAYWSSTEANIYESWQQNFADGKQTQCSKSSLNFVRAVRSF